MKACSRCKDQYYCSPECQKRDWQYHKNSCQKKHKIYICNKNHASLKKLLSERII